MLNSHKNMIERKTYSVLEWLGDIGGLFEGLSLIASHLVAPAAAYVMRAELLSKLFEPSESDQNCCTHLRKLKRAESKIERELDLIYLVKR